MRCWCYYLCLAQGHKSEFPQLLRQSGENCGDRRALPMPLMHFLVSPFIWTFFFFSCLSWRVQLSEVAVLIAAVSCCYSTDVFSTGENFSLSCFSLAMFLHKQNEMTNTFTCISIFVKDISATICGSLWVSWEERMRLMHLQDVPFKITGIYKGGIVPRSAQWTVCLNWFMHVLFSSFLCTWRFCVQSPHSFINEALVQNFVPVTAWRLSFAHGRPFPTLLLRR